MRNLRSLYENKYNIFDTNPNNISNSISYKILDKPTGQVLHITKNQKLARFLHKKLNLQGYSTIVLINK